jgi:hypothetical protein
MRHFTNRLPLCEEADEIFRLFHFLHSAPAPAQKEPSAK